MRIIVEYLSETTLTFNIHCITDRITLIYITFSIIPFKCADLTVKEDIKCKINYHKSINTSDERIS